MVSVLLYYIGNFSEPRVLKLISSDTEVLVCVKPNYFQQRNIRKLADTYLSIPEVKKACDAMLEELKKGEGTDYELDIKPWLGKEFAFTIPRFDQPDRFLAMIEYTDKAKAQAYLDKLNQEPGARQENYQGVNIMIPEDGVARALSGSYIIIASDRELIERTVDRQNGVLKDNITQSPGYQKVMDNLTGGRSAFAYMKFTPRLKDEMALSDGPLGIADRIDYQDVGVSLSFEGNGVVTNYLVTVGNAPSFYKKRGTVKQEMKATLDLLPEDCIGFLHLSNLGDLLQEAMQNPGGDRERFDSLDSVLGIDFQRDLLDIMRGDVTMAVMPQHGSFFGDRTAPISLALETGVKDRSQAEGTMDKLTGFLKKNGYIVTSKESNGFQVYDIEGQYGFDELGLAIDQQRLVLGSSPQLIDLLVNKHNTLRSSENYRKAFAPFPSNMDPIVFVNVPRVMTVYESTLSSIGKRDYQENVKPWLTPVQSLGLVDSGWDEKSGLMKGGIFLRIEK